LVPEWVVDVDVAIGDGNDHPVVVAGCNVGHLKLNRGHKLTSSGLILLRVWCAEQRDFEEGKKNLIHQEIITEDQYS
jgi:hypothetical protein